MKIIIIIFSIFYAIRGQYIENESSTFSSHSDITTTSDWNLISQTTTEEDRTISNTFSTEFPSLVSSSENISDHSFNNDQINTSTILSDFVSEFNSEETRSSLFVDDHWSLSSTEADLHSTIFTEQTNLPEESKMSDQWFSVNISNREDSNNSSIFWKKVNDPSWNGATYILRSEGRCLNHMCDVKLKYNGSLSSRVSGCLSFILWTRGHPVGQLWIEEDEEQQSLSEKVELTKNTLRVQHSLKSKMKNLSIDARILFTKSPIDIITLSNLNVDWKGPCQKHRSVSTDMPEIMIDLSTLTSEDSTLMNSLATTNVFEMSEDNLIIESSTTEFSSKFNNRRSFSFVNENNIGYFLFFIFLFCLLILLSSFIYGLWSIQRHYRFIWYIPYEYPIQFLARRSIRSSTRSDNKIFTLSEICFHTDFEEDYLTTKSSQSTSSLCYTDF